MSFDSAIDFREAAAEDQDFRSGRRVEPVSKGDEERQLREVINAGLDEHFDGDEDVAAGAEVLTPLEELQVRLDKEFYRLDQALDLLDQPEKVAAELIEKWAAMVDLAKSYGVADYDAVNLFRSVLVAKIIQMAPENVSMEHEVEPGEGTEYFDVIKLMIARIGTEPFSSHPSLRDVSRVPDVNTPLPIFRPEIVDALRTVVPSTTVDRPNHNRRYGNAETQRYWRIAARTEYLSEARKLVDSGLDLRAIATEVFGSSEGVENLLLFLEQHTHQSPYELAQAWSNESFEPRPEKKMTVALRQFDARQQEIRAQE